MTYKYFIPYLWANLSPNSKASYSIICASKTQSKGKCVCYPYMRDQENAYTRFLFVERTIKEQCS